MARKGIPISLEHKRRLSIAFKGRFVGEKNPSWDGGKINIPCMQCGIVFHAHKSGNRKFCSKKCSQEWHKGKPSGHHGWTGPLNPKWKGGISSEKETVRKHVKYQQWRQQVFIRDHFTCQECEHKSGTDIIVHHKKPFSVLLQEVKEYLPLLSFSEAILEYSPLWEISNGVVLCRGCHDKIHKSI